MYTNVWRSFYIPLSNAINNNSIEYIIIAKRLIG